ncbi:hypothetical protein QKW35_18965 [Pontibacterium granulatum]|nr:hypothetical protein [Pontibacterium granulatum]MDI3326465.1 hypothetical protein [Pontibacterium granulatum]
MLFSITRAAVLNASSFLDRCSLYIHRGFYLDGRFGMTRLV